MKNFVDFYDLYSFGETQANPPSFKNVVYIQVFSLRGLGLVTWEEDNGRVESKDEINKNLREKYSDILLNLLKLHKSFI